MSREEKYDAVNRCETLPELADVIRSFADDEGMIQGRTRKFNAEKMAVYCELFDSFPPNVLTREFGIRQQAFYINHY